MLEIENARQEVKLAMYAWERAAPGKAAQEAHGRFSEALDALIETVRAETCKQAKVQA